MVGWRQPSVSPPPCGHPLGLPLPPPARPPRSGVKKVSNDGALTWPAANRYSICGDAAEERKWDAPGKVAKTYREGQVINVDVIFAQNHLGRMNVRLCPLDATDEAQCKLLER
jgi:hypothetical protein